MTETLVTLPSFARLSERVWRVLGQNPGKFTLQGTNTYLLGTGSRKLLLDCGEGKPEYIPLLKQSLESLGAGTTISNIIISHTHYDHWGGLESILEQFPNAKDIGVHKFPLPDKAARSESMKPHVMPSHLPVQPLSDAQVFKADDVTLRVIHTPGHCADHCTFYLEEEKAIFTADCLLGQGTAVFENLGEYLTGLKRLLDLKPGKLYPGHGPVIEDGTSKLAEYIKHREEREQQIVGVLQRSQDANGLTIMQMVEVIYESYPQSLYPAAAYGVYLHLEKLLKEGRVKRLEVDAEPPTDKDGFEKELQVHWALVGAVASSGKPGML